MTILYPSRFKEFIKFTKMAMLEGSKVEDANANRTENVDSILYLYGTPLLIFFCIISIAINIKVLMSVFWIKRPLSPTLYISLSLAGIITILHYILVSDNASFTI